ncbi:MAG: M28 family peptidase [Candidatus Eisenbacteria bacterium]|nr:M28 family peptidase [Candidatus Eisenbacteria bacterium]
MPEETSGSGGRREGNRRRLARRTTRTLLALLLAVVQLAAAGCSGKPLFDEERAFELLEEQCSFGPRPPGSEAHEAMLTWLVEKVSEATDLVRTQRFTAVSDTGEVQLTNVVASFNPDARERVLLAAHWDTRAVAERDPDPTRRDQPILGANDGASGVAVLLEFARLVATDPPDVGVDIVFFDGEDGGDGGGLPDWCLGSRYYASTMGDYCPRYAVVVDMVGDAQLSIPRERNSAVYSPRVVDAVWAAARRAGSVAFADRLGKPIYDDHVPLLRAGVPAALVIDFDYAYWHTLDDTPERCSPASLGEVGRTLVELIY